jgi:hypothetical protein
LRRTLVLHVLYSTYYASNFNVQFINQSIINKLYYSFTKFAFPFTYYTRSKCITQNICGGSEHIAKMIYGNINATPSGGILNILHVASTTTNDARGTPAMPLLVNINTSNIVSCVAVSR